jgi:acyl-coenzyme A synthetase/AMP-(fatty) acid ligase
MKSLPRSTSMKGITEAKIRDRLSDRLSHFMIPDAIVLFDNIPRKETNKRRKTELKDEYY